MQVTRAGEYGVLGLLCLARRQAGAVVMMEEISQEEDIPRSFLAKIFQSLARAGIVRSVRGIRGGFSLAKAPSEVTTLQVIEAIEGPIAFQRCMQSSATCPHLGGCPLCGLFERAQTGVKDVFSSTTLADLLKTHPRPNRTSARPAPGDPSPARSLLSAPKRMNQRVSV